MLIRVFKISVESIIHIINDLDIIWHFNQMSKTENEIKKLFNLKIHAGQYSSPPLQIGQ